MKHLCLLIGLFLNIFNINVYSQGVNSIHFESEEIVAWATQCDISRGYMNIADESLGLADYGSPENAVGIYSGDFVSLGDAGVAVLQFNKPLKNEEGPDFVIFENSFFNPPGQEIFAFCEFAFVEVSSDGINYYRFPAVSSQQVETQVGGFEAVDVGLYSNLAGVDVAGYGTMFDLEEFVEIDVLNINSITHVRIVDVVGSIDEQWGSEDINENLINDPYPTAFGSSGFDLAAVGIIHENSSNDLEIANLPSLKIYPNPIKDMLYIESDEPAEIIEIYSIAGELIDNYSNCAEINLAHLSKGVFLLRVYFADKVYSQKIVKH